MKVNVGDGFKAGGSGIRIRQVGLTEWLKLGKLPNSTAASQSEHHLGKR